MYIKIFLISIVLIKTHFMSKWLTHTLLRCNYLSYRHATWHMNYSLSNNSCSSGGCHLICMLIFSNLNIQINLHKIESKNKQAKLFEDFKSFGIPLTKFKWNNFDTGSFIEIENDIPSSIIFILPVPWQITIFKCIISVLKWVIFNVINIHTTINLF